MEIYKQVAVVGSKKEFIDYCFDNKLKRNICYDTAIKYGVKYIMVNTPNRAYGRRFDDAIYIGWQIDDATIEAVRTHTKILVD